MVQIDGKKVRSLREEKGLTQLYLATAVEVTTDTISRWENRRYPAIKKDNALRLAEALEVTLEDILDQAEQDTIQENELSSEDSKETNKRTVGLSAPSKLRIGAVVLFILGLLSWQLFPFGQSISFEAVRIMPNHTAPSQPFPVVVKLTSHASQAAPFILRESIPEKTEHVSLVSSQSKPSGFSKKVGEMKWIKKVQGEFTLGYQLMSSIQKMGKVLQVSGVITLRKFIGSEQQVTGDHLIELAPFHWADTNKDNKIDDQEILAVYDDYSEVEGVGLDMELIEDIWFGSKYFWDKSKKGFVIVQ